LLVRAVWRVLRLRLAQSAAPNSAQDDRLAVKMTDLLADQEFSSALSVDTARLG
jgi:hypothetical protein